MDSIISKKCTYCGKEQERSEFYKNNRYLDGLTRWCKKCVNKNSALLRKGFSSEERAQIIGKVDRKGYTRYPLRSPTLKEVRLLAIQNMGGVCNNCGYSDIRALQIDHIAGGGHKEYKEIGQWKVYKKAYEFSKTPNNNVYQVLCANCNWIKKHENKEF